MSIPQNCYFNKSLFILHLLLVILLLLLLLQYRCLVYSNLRLVEVSFIGCPCSMFRSMAYLFGTISCFVLLTSVLWLDRFIIFVFIVFFWRPPSRKSISGFDSNRSLMSHFSFLSFTQTLWSILTPNKQTLNPYHRTMVIYSWVDTLHCQFTSSSYTLSANWPCVFFSFLSTLSDFASRDSSRSRYGLRPSMKFNWKHNEQRPLRWPLPTWSVTSRRAEKIPALCCKFHRCNSNVRRVSTPRPALRARRRVRSWRCHAVSRNDAPRIRKHHRPPAFTVSTWRSTGGRSALTSCTSLTTRSCAR